MCLFSPLGQGGGRGKAGQRVRHCRFQLARKAGEDPAYFTAEDGDVPCQGPETSALFPSCWKSTCRGSGLRGRHGLYPGGALTVSVWGGTEAVITDTVSRTRNAGEPEAVP